MRSISSGRDLRLPLLVLGAVAAVIAVCLRATEFRGAIEQSWPPFVLVAGLLLIGVLANQAGLFGLAAEGLDRLPGPPFVIYLASMAMVAAVTVVLNLDTSVAFLTPVLVYLARRRRVVVAPFLYGSVFIANSASLLLPGSNLTNLLVLAPERISGAEFVVRSFWPWLVAVIVTTAGVWLLFLRDTSESGSELPDLHRKPADIAVACTAILAAAAFILLLTNAAIPVVTIGLAGCVIQLVRGRLHNFEILDRIDVLVLLSLFFAACSLGTLARVWNGPAKLLASAGRPETAIVGAVASALINNLPAAVLLSAQAPLHPRSLLIGLDFGPNLAVTGSLSALIWWQAARSVGERPSVLRYSLAGIIIAPLTIAGALLVSPLNA